MRYAPQAAALALAVVALLAPGLMSAPAGAHEVGLSRGVYRARGSRVHAEISIATAELRTLARQLDRDRDGALDEVELLAATAAIRERVVAALSVRAPAGPCPGALTGLTFAGVDGLTIAASYTCPGPADSFVVDVRGLLEHADPGHRHIAELHAPGAEARVVAGHIGQLELASPAPRVDGGPTGQVERPADGDPGDRRPETPQAPSAYLVLGVEHILAGVDHLVFILGLVLARGPARGLVAAITAFTVGHSLSLAAVVLGGWTPDPAWVEPAIALSIAYVGLENLFCREPRGRWRITGLFGLVHGLGFAGALVELGLRGAAAGGPLLLFNVGVELAQLAVLIPALLALHLVERASRRGARRLCALLSGAVLVAGLLWFGARVLALLP